MTTNITTEHTPAPAHTEENELDQILQEAHQAAAELRGSSRSVRAQYLKTVANALDASADELIRLAREETNLGEPRLRGELTRTTFQLRLFAEVLEDGGYLHARVDHADPEWPMGAPRPDLRRTQLPLGPVLVFSASNFPFAFSVAGGDTASALAAGCPVVVKAHSGHPRLSHRTATILRCALDDAGAPQGTFGIIYGTAAGRSAIQDPRIKASGFTGSITAGRALFDLAAARPEPIPFYGELGSNNPVVVTPAADARRGEEIAEQFIGSFSLGSGQFCTKPGTLFLPAGSRVLESLRSAALPDGTAMLNESIHAGYVSSVEALREHGAEVLNEGAEPFGSAPSPTIHLVTGAKLLEDPAALLAECFGPSALVVEYEDQRQLIQLAEAFEGQLTASLQAEPDDDVAALIEVLAQKAGRLLWNQWPTGVSVTHAQHHGGPYPASTASGTTSVGTAAIGRFLRPIAYQGFPDHALPDELRDEPSSAVPRMVDGVQVAADA